jgi:predicted Co/Zn/Cd cation transporter (cation efflux family)
MCSAERAALQRRSASRQRIINVIVLSLTVLCLGISFGSICAIADLPHGIVFVVLVLWSVWACRLLFAKTQ